ncbi:uncharacterized protein LOC135489685 [Lineus longissimus]|uniref:uncharacterized protein LOC135489685 n=1 Tax=Lineus longissimus TaxID=88925 RepID=UPI002B4DC27E
MVWSMPPCLLNTTINGVNGTYNPIAQPVLSGHRAYVLTEFVPQDASDKVKVQDVGPRLYSVDILRIAAPRMNITWFIDLTPIPAARRKNPEKRREDHKWSDTEFNMATDKNERKEARDAKEEDIPLTSTPRVIAAAYSHVFVMKQDWRNLTWYNFYDIIDNGWNASYEASFSTQYADDISSDYLATHEHGFYIWLYSRKYGAITRFNYITKELSATVFFGENIFPKCELIFTSNLMVQTPVNATDTYKIIVGMKSVGAICKLKLATIDTPSSLGSGEHFLIVLELIKQAPANDVYQPISIISTGDFAIRGQIVTYLSDGNNSSSKPTLAAVADNLEEAILLNFQ